MNSNPNAQNANNANPDADTWGSLSNYGNKLKEDQEKAKEFTSNELKRLAEITGRTPDDEGIIKLNLVLRNEAYNLLKDTVQDYQNRGIMVQQGTLEDLATAKRELEEAMFLYDDTFAKDDAKTQSLNEQQHRANIKDQNRGDKHNSEGTQQQDLNIEGKFITKDGQATTGNSWVRSRLARNFVYDEKRGVVSEHRDAAASRLSEDLDGISEKFKNETIGGENLYKTYMLNKGNEPLIKDRRMGFQEAGKNGLLTRENGKPEVDWTLYPHAPKPAAEVPEEENPPVEPDKPEDTPDEPEDEPEDEPDEPEDEPDEPEDEPEDEPDEPDEPEDEPEDEPDDPESPEEYDPLVAINADFTHDKQELAHDYAEKELNAETAKANFFKKIWKGNLFKKYYLKKYENEILSGERTLDVNGERMDIDGVVERTSGSAIKRFIDGVMDDPETSDYIHRNIGGEGKGEKLSEADAETTAAVRAAIEEFAQAKIPEGGSLNDLKIEFNEKIKRIQAEKRDQGEEVDPKLINNYYEVAVQARERIEHGLAIEKVMEGFKVYNADVRNNIRTEAHRDNLDKIINRLESSAIGQFIPAEVIAAAVGTAYSLTQTGARALAGAGGGIIASGIIAGLRERNRTTEDRTRMQRDIASGLEYEGKPGEDARGKRAKYEARIGGTLYDLRPASELTDNINKAIESQDSEAILRAIAEAKVRIDYSDSEQKDLIAYSSPEKIGDERLALDKAVIEARKSLSEEDASKLKDMISVINKEIDEDVTEQDENFRKVRTAQALKQAGKTMAVGAAFFFGSQEVMALISPSKVGLLEKFGLVKQNNNTDASETILASAIGGPRARIDTVPNVSGDDTAEIQRLRDNGYTGIEKSGPSTSIKKTVVDIDPSQSNHKFNGQLDGFANNGTVAHDGNELRLYLENGQFRSGLTGNSTMPNGDVLNYNDLLADGKVKALLTIGDSKFEVAGTLDNSGQLVLSENGVFTTVTGETIKAVSDTGEKLYKYVEIVADQGVDANGVTHYITMATDVGRDTFSGTIQEVVETAVEHPAVYDFVKEIPGTTFYGGVALPGVTSRVGLGETRNRSTSNTNNETSPSSNNPTGSTETSSQSSGETSSQSSEQLSQTEIDRNRFAENFANTFESLPQEEKTEILLALRELAEIQAAEQQEALDNETADENPETETTEEQGTDKNPEAETTEEQENEPVIEQDLRNLIGEAGVAALMDRNGDISSDEVDAVMGTLDQDSRNRVREWLDAHPGYGIGTRAWFEINDALQAE